MKLILGSGQAHESQTSSDSVLQIQQGQATLLLSLMQPKSLTSVETASQSEPLEQAQATSEDFWRNTFAALKENGTVQAHIQAIEGL